MILIPSSGVTTYALGGEGMRIRVQGHPQPCSNGGWPELQETLTGKPLGFQKSLLGILLGTTIAVLPCGMCVRENRDA